jgi:peptidoglycan/xylan/chitin deacetylase (PgdA/CDA1 family)
MLDKHSLIRSANDVAYVTGLAAMAESRYGGVGTIFMLHSIVGDDEYLPRDNTRTSLHFLEKALKHYRQSRVPIVSLSDAVRRLETGDDERFVCFTFDDGYRDNLTLALPLFRKYQAPLTIYVTNAFLDRTYPDYWWGQLRHLILERDELSEEDAGRSMSLQTPQEKKAAYLYLMSAIGKGALPKVQATAMFDRYGISNAEALDRDAMTAGELRDAAAAEPLLEIGGHTRSHARLAPLDTDAATAEIAHNKRYLQDLLGREISHLAYPYGDADSCGARDFDLALRAGYRTAVTTRLGNLFPAHLEHLAALPRMRFIGGCESVGFLEAQRAGLITAVTSRLGNPVVTV